jgi:hypothetical protein
MRGIRVCALVVLAAASALQAGIIVDQQQLSWPVYMARFNQTDLAQSFQQTSSNIAGAAIQLWVNGETNPGDITIALWDNLPNASGTMLASGTALSVLQGQWAEVSWAPLAIVPDTTYYLVFTSTDGLLGIAGNEANPYPRGQVYANAGYSPFPNFDYTFRTYAESGAVPEPASLWLVAGALAAVFALRRRIQ